MVRVQFSFEWSVNAVKQDEFLFRFQVQSQPSTSPPPLPLISSSQRKKEQTKENSRPLEVAQQRSLDHQSIFSQSTASLSSFVYLSTFHLGPSYGTVEDITNLDYDDNEDDMDEELNGIGADSESGEESEEDYDVYETVRARSDLKINIAGLLAASGGTAASGPPAECGGTVANEVGGDTSIPPQGAKGLEIILQPKKSITPTPENTNILAEAVSDNK